MPSPPALTEAVLRWLLPPDDAETICGDLEEEFHDVARRRGRVAAACWHAGQVASIVRAQLALRAGDPVDVERRRGMMAAFRQDLSFALRTLRTQPGFAATVVIMLALGIGANVAIFSVVRAVLLKPLPFAEPERLMLVHLTAPDLEDPAVVRRMIWSYPKYEVFRAHQQAFASTTMFAAAGWNITGTDAPEQAVGEFVESTYFQTLGVAAVAGRTFTADETRAPGSAPIAVLGHGVWVRRFGGHPHVIGRSIGLNGVPHTIVGVLPQGFRGLTGRAEIWVPVTAQPPDVLAENWNHSYTVVARRNPETSVAAAQAAVALLGELVANEIPDPKGQRGGWGALAVPLDDERVAPLIRRSLLLLLLAVASVLLLVCINVANLTLARALGRQREVAIRLALGASRRRIVRQLMTESVVLALVSAAVGIAVAYGLGVTAGAMLPDLGMVLPTRAQSSGLTRVGLGGVGFDAGVLAFTVGIALAAAAIFGIVPAWRASRRDLTDAMKRGSAGALSPGTRGFALRNVLVVAEMALALILLTAGGLMLKSVVRLQATELGFDPSSLLSVRVALPSPAYAPPTAARFLQDVLARLGARPEVESVAYGSCAPVSGGCNMTTVMPLDRPVDPSAKKPLVGVLWASPTYFDTLGIRLVRGRAFTPHDRAGQPKVVVINETSARAFWGAADPIGKRVSVGQGGFGDGAEVIGVVADVRYGAVETSVMPDIYLPLAQSARMNGLLFVRSRAPVSAVVPAVRSEVRALDADLPLTDIKPMRERIGDATWRTRMGAALLGAFAALALLLAALGVYGVMSQGVQQRTREIGVRMALGAARGDIFRLILGRVARLAVAGVVCGVLVAVPAMRLLTALLYQVRPGDPGVIAALTLLLLAVALLAGYLPARRAARVDPLTTLRAD